MVSQKNIEFYAKSNPPETLFEHTQCVLNEYEKFKELYCKNEITDKIFWELLYIVCLYHDFGKVDPCFQNKIIKSISNEEKFDCEINVNIPHNILSPLFLPAKLKEKYPKSFKALVHAIMYHHEREVDVDPRLLKLKARELEKYVPYLNHRFQLNINRLNHEVRKEIKNERRIKENDHDYLLYIKLKGLLNRLDYSASAHVEVEIPHDQDFLEKVKNFLKSKSGKLRDLQDFSLMKKDKNLVLIASTGMGKTEAALLWLNHSKGFFTLPLRVSLNALFKRIYEEIGYKKTGLLHSTSYDYLVNVDDEDPMFRYVLSRQFSFPLIFSTIDQLFTFPFKHKGYERIYSTLSVSKVVIDEIQAYSPKIIAAILRGIEMINKIGGKFMIMTATLPNIVKEFLEENDIPFELKEFPSNRVRHRIYLSGNTIEDDLNLILKIAENHKVLIITNTVRRAVELYEKLKEKNIRVNLLHSLFISKDRAIKEKLIQNENKPGIWISTQIVEASLDIDFDYLFTELSTLDSLFQRMGRCYRKREYIGKKPNVYVYFKNVSGIGSIYDSEIFSKSVEFLLPFSGKFINEKDKMRSVEKLYDKTILKDTNYYKEFKRSMSFLRNVFDYELKKEDVQKVLRDMNSIRVIPIEIFRKNKFLFDNYKNASDFREKYEFLRKIRELTLDIPIYKVRTDLIPSEIKGIYIINQAYSHEKGLENYEVISNLI